MAPKPHSFCHPRKRAKEIERVCLGSIITAAIVLRGGLCPNNHFKPTNRLFGVWVPSSRRYGAPWDDAFLGGTLFVGLAIPLPLPLPTTRGRVPSGWLAKVGFRGSGKGSPTRNWINPMRPSLCPDERGISAPENTSLVMPSIPFVCYAKTAWKARAGTVCRTLSSFCCTRENSVLGNRAACEQGARPFLFAHKKPNKFNNLPATRFSPPASNQRQQIRGR